RAQRGFVNRERHGHVDVVAVAAEERMRLHAHADIEVAVRAPVPADVALSGNANPRAVGQTRGDGDGDRLRSHLDLLPAADPASRLPQATRSAAMRACLREHHVAARRLDGAGTVTVRAARLGDVLPPGAVAPAARLLARDDDRPLAARERLIE